MFLKKSQTRSDNLLSGNLGTRQEISEFLKNPSSILGTVLPLAASGTAGASDGQP